MKKRIVILGDGGMAVRCVEKVLGREALSVPVLVYHDDASTWSSALQARIDTLGVPGMAVANVNDRSVLDELEAIAPDLALSVNNFDIIKSDLLALPADGIVNFHNGPLPDYRGVNIPSWAIINGETEHGVCWHFVDDGIDTGDIVASARFPLDDRETAISLIIKCIEYGIDLLDELLDRYINGTLSGERPDGEGRYFSRKMSPDGGFLDFEWPYDRLSAIVRGLSFHPFENDFTYPRIRAADASLIVSEIERVDGPGEETSYRIGEVVEIDDLGLIVRAGDSFVRLSGLMSEDLVPTAPADISDRYGIDSGFVLGR